MRYLAIMLLGTLLLFVAVARGAEPTPALYDSFVRPPAAARPMVRWWWFGPKTQDPEIVREIGAMKAAGFGGFELQTVYPLALSGNVRFLSPENLHAIRLAGKTARADGLRMDMTLGSGWPFGGPHIPAELASADVHLLQIPAQAGHNAPPGLKPGEKLVAAFAGKSPATAHLLQIADDRAVVAPEDLPGTLYFVISGRTGQLVKRAAYGAQGFVLDHMSAAAVQRHLDVVGEKLLQAFGDAPPYAVFSDSLEAYGSDWSDDLLAEFRRCRGYDLRPHLLALFDDGPDSAAIRHDWAETLSELTEARDLAPVTAWAHAHHTRFRAQVYGIPPVRLSANTRVDLADGEGNDWQAFTTSRWASSANHAMGQAVSSAESWTWLHFGAFQATPLDVKAEADRLMLEGINHFIAHGWPYSPPDVAEPGWSFYAAAALNDHNPWWGVMPDVNAYLQRLSFLLQQGKPVTDVAIYLPEEDALAALHPCGAGECHISVSESMAKMLPPQMQAQILRAGYNFDYTDDGLIAAYGLPYHVVILPDVRRISAETLKKLTGFVRAGGTVLAVGRTPDLAPGFLQQRAETAAVRKLSQQLFALKNARVIQPADVGAALRVPLTPDVAGLSQQLGFVHRKLPDGDIYFVVNTGNAPVSAKLSFRDGVGPGQWWEARDGAVHTWPGGEVALAPYQSRVFVFGAPLLAPVPPQNTPLRAKSRPLNCSWSLAFGKNSPLPLPQFVSWTDLPGKMHFSGEAHYDCDLNLTQQDLAGATVLDFGPGKRVLAGPPQGPGFQALLTSPVREAAVVLVNGQRAGSVWAPPYRLPLRAYLHVGENHLEIRVGNTAVNTLSGRPPADTRALEAKFGRRFTPQNMTNLQPLPSGILRAPVFAAAYENG